MDVGDTCQRGQLKAWPSGTGASMFAVRLLGAVSTFLRLGWAGSKEVERRTREAAGGESTQRGFAKESKGCSW